jgi:AraC family transcriptional regulator
MAHAFGRSLGIPIMAYARGLRLAQAARELAAGAPDIIGVALDAGYGSHEALTRAFREQFGLTPEAVRAEGTVSNLNLMEPMQMAKPLRPRIRRSHCRQVALGNPGCSPNAYVAFREVFE